MSLDGFSAGPGQSLQHPLGVNGPELMDWFFHTRAWREMSVESATVRSIAPTVAVAVAILHFGASLDPDYPWVPLNVLMSFDHLLALPTFAKLCGLSCVDQHRDGDQAPIAWRQIRPSPHITVEHASVRVASPGAIRC